MEERKGPLPPIPQPVDRRRAPRHPARIAGYIEVEDEQELAMVRDISATGSLVLTRAVFEPTEHIKLTLTIPGGDERSVEGTIRRVEKTPPGVSDIWPYRVAIQFDEAISYADELGELAKVKARIGRRDSKQGSSEK